MPPEIVELLKFIGFAGGALEGSRRGLKWAVGYYVNGKVDDLGSEMSRRFDNVDMRINEVENDVAYVQDTIEKMRDGRVSVEGRLGRLEGQQDE